MPLRIFGEIFRARCADRVLGSSFRGPVHSCRAERSSDFPRRSVVLPVGFGATLGGEQAGWVPIAARRATCSEARRVFAR